MIGIYRLKHPDGRVHIDRNPAVKYFNNSEIRVAIFEKDFIEIRTKDGRVYGYRTAEFRAVLA